jgi:hypothetical protein
VLVVVLVIGLIIAGFNGAGTMEGIDNEHDNDLEERRTPNVERWPFVC